MSEAQAKIFIVEGNSTEILKPTDIVAMDKEMAIELYKQLYMEQLIDIEDIIFQARVKETKEMVKN